MHSTFKFLLLLAGAAARETCDSSVQGSFAAAHWPEGFAVTGGAGGDTVVATTGRDFVDFVGSDEPLVVMVQGYLFVPARRRLRRDDDEAALLPAVGGHEIASHKTILGIGEDATLTFGWLKIDEATNIIIRNVRFTGARDAEGDALTIIESTYVWIDHCTFDDALDGLVDIVHASNHIAVSWNHFYNHGLGSLVGNSDSKGYKDWELSATYHHNWFQQDRRSPRARFGRVHSYNNYHDGQDRGPASYMGARVVVEHSHFYKCEKPTKAYSTENATYGDPSGYLVLRGNKFEDNEYEPEARGTIADAFEPADIYAYVLDDVDDVKDLVTACAGAGKWIPDFEPVPIICAELSKETCKNTAGCEYEKKTCSVSCSGLDKKTCKKTDGCKYKKKSETCKED